MSDTTTPADTCDLCGKPAVVIVYESPIAAICVCFEHVLEVETEAQDEARASANEGVHHHRVGYTWLDLSAQANWDQVCRERGWDPGITADEWFAELARNTRKGG